MRTRYLLPLGGAALSALFMLETSAVAGPNSAANAAGAQASSHKPDTIPDDGSGDVGIPSTSHLVQSLLATHPNEDLVICIAGCRAAGDRVVYAAPAAPKPAVQPAAIQAEPAKAEPAISEAPAASGKPAEPVAVPAAKAAEKAIESQQGNTPAQNAEAEKPADGSQAEESKTAEDAKPATDEGSKMEPTAAGSTEESSRSEESTGPSDDEPASNTSRDDSSDNDSSGDGNRNED